MATTTNFGWVTPNNTDLVKDGASAIRTLGSSIDSSMGDLKGGTTGQVLSKTTGTDMDFTWVTTDDTDAIQNAIVDAKGDLIAASAADTPARLAVGANDLLVTAASGEATGLKYTGAWTSFTPTWTNFTVGNAAVTGRYCKIGKVVDVYVKVTLGSTSSVTGTLIITNLPTASNSGMFEARSYLLDQGVGGYFGGLEIYGATGYISAFLSNSTYVTPSVANATVPFTWGNGDSFSIQARYEVA
jgi:hypothetical protein